ncbi:MAG: hypothetical protein R3C45_11875 [Phycisphaerales bacterium]
MLTLVAREGDRAPGTPDGVVFSNITGHNLNDAGDTAFRGQVTGGGASSSSDLGIWSETSGGLALVAREGDPAPGAGPGAEFSNMVNPLFNDVGLVAFRGDLRGSAVGTNDTGIWLGTPGALSLLARRETQVSGMAPGVIFSGSEGIGLPVLNNIGQVAFRATFDGTGIDENNNQVVLLADSGLLSIVAREGEAAPGTGAGVVFNSFLPDVSLNDAGYAAFAGSLRGPGVDSTNQLGMWVGSATGLELVWRQGDAAPGTQAGVVFDFADIEEPAVSAAGEITFRATVLDTGPSGSRDAGIWSGGPGALELVALERSHAPGTGDGVRFGTFLEPVINGAGQTAFAASVTGSGINGNNSLGIWATDPNGTLILIARTGDVFDVNDDPVLEDLRVISDLSMIPDSGGEDGRSNPFNDLGQLAFRLRFTDGTEGIFVANVPEPSLVAIVCVMGPLVACRRRF